MRGMKIKLAIASVVAAVAAGVGASSSSAAVQQFAVNPQATILLNGTDAEVTGVIRCTFGDTVDVEAIVTQSKGSLFTEGIGDTVVNCTGSLQSWTVEAPAEIGRYSPGKASLLAQAFDSDGSSATDNETIHLSSK